MSELQFLKSFPARKSIIADPAKTLLIFDRRLLSISREFRAWAAGFPQRIGLESGEGLKQLAQFPARAEKLARLAGKVSPRELTVLAVGGGSIGDFAGFFASIYKRGVRLVHVPSTWLAAIDSSHGGKTALNAGGAKNQFGTFYPAARVVLVRSLLIAQPEERVRDAMGELGKMALIDGGRFARDLAKTRLRDGDLLWAFLEPAIRAKLKVVAADPLELGGHRQILNLGHTVGHVFESALGWSHGRAVAQGLFFALDFSLERGLLKARDFERASDLLTHQLGLSDAPERPARLSKARFLQLLQADKKLVPGAKVTFIFLEGIGETIRLPVSFPELTREAIRQGWLA